jgi:hypothetical protein
MLRERAILKGSLRRLRPILKCSERENFLQGSLNRTPILECSEKGILQGSLRREETHP